MSPFTFFIALANFLSALGGGGLLARGLTTLSAVGGWQVDSVLAYLVGTALSLVLILGFRHWVAKAGVWLSLSGTLLALALSGMVAQGVAPSQAGFIFVGLCLVFACIFVPRTFRVDVAANYSNQVAWLEFAYSGGYLVSLGLWRVLPSVSLSTSFLLCGLCLALSCAVDICASQVRKPDENRSSAAKPSAPIRAEHKATVVAGIALISLLTLVVQIGTQRISSLTGDSLPLIVFDLGILLAPLITVRAKVCASQSSSRRFFGTALCFGSARKPIVSLYWGAVLLMALTALAYALVPWCGVNSPATLFLMGVVACGYEMMAIVLLETIGRTCPGRGFVSLAYGVMAVSAVVVYASLLRLAATPYALVWLSLGAMALVEGLRRWEKGRTSLYRAPARCTPRWT